MFFLSELRHAEGDKSISFFVVVLLKSYSFSSRQGSAASPGGLGSGQPSSGLALCSLPDFITPSVPARAQSAVPLCARQEEAGRVPFSGHVLAAGIPPVCDCLFKINTLLWSVPLLLLPLWAPFHSRGPQYVQAVPDATQASLRLLRVGDLLQPEQVGAWLPRREDMELSQASQVAQIQLFPCSVRPVSPGSQVPLLWLWPYVCLGEWGGFPGTPRGRQHPVGLSAPRMSGREEARGHQCFQMEGNLSPKSCGLN